MIVTVTDVDVTNVVMVTVVNDIADVVARDGVATNDKMNGVIADGCDGVVAVADGCDGVVAVADGCDGVVAVADGCNADSRDGMVIVDGDVVADDGYQGKGMALTTLGGLSPAAWSATTMMLPVTKSSKSVI